MDVNTFFIRVFDFLTRFPFVIIATQFVTSVYAERRRGFLLRAISAVAAYCVAGTCLLNYVYAPFFMAGGWFSFSYLIIFLLSLLAISHCFSMRFDQTVFGGLSAYVFQNAFFYVRALLDYLFPNGRDLVFFFVSFLVLLVLEGLFYIVFVKHMHEVGDSTHRALPMLIYSGSVILVVYVMHSWATYIGDMNFTVYIFAILLNLMLLVQQFNMFEHSRLLRDNETIERMLKMSEQQQRMSVENVEVINRKCHDLKYQIAALRTAGGENIAQELYELEKSVDIYEHIAQTGNRTLDVVLTEKKQFCSSHGIKFNYIVEAKDLGIIASSVDLYSLFGNLIDNAIESVQGLDAEKRIISLSVHSERELLRIHTDNWCEEKVEFFEGLPVTKKDKRYHGFGVKSVRYIAEKYGGNIVMRLEECRFCVDILLPIRLSTKTD